MILSPKFYSKFNLFFNHRCLTLIQHHSRIDTPLKISLSSELLLYDPHPPFSVTPFRNFFLHHVRGFVETSMWLVLAELYSQIVHLSLVIFSDDLRSYLKLISLFLILLSFGTFQTLIIEAVSEHLYFLFFIKFLFVLDISLNIYGCLIAHALFIGVIYRFYIQNGNKLLPPIIIKLESIDLLFVAIFFQGWQISSCWF